MLIAGNLTILAQSSNGGGENLGEVISLLAILIERTATMLLNHDKLEAAVKKLDITLRNATVDLLTKYDAIKKERDQLKEQLAKGVSITEDQAIIDAREQEVLQLAEALENFRKTL